MAVSFNYWPDTRDRERLDAIRDRIAEMETVAKKETLAETMKHLDEYRELVAERDAIIEGWLK